MLVSYDKNFLFVHVPKTAGTSITNSLSRHAEHPELLWENRLLSALGINANLVGPWKRRRFRGHCTAQDVRDHLPAKVYETLFKFAFVRNPWSLLVSLYNFIPTRPNHRKQKLVASMTFDEFVDVWSQRAEVRQLQWVCDHSRNLLVDYVGYHETLSADFSTVCRQIDVTPDLPRDNVSRRVDYREFYDERLRKLVAARLAEDIEFFGYDFDSVSANRKQELQPCRTRIAA